MFSHIMIGGDDLSVAKKFYDAALGAMSACQKVRWIPKGGCSIARRPAYSPSRCRSMAKPTTGANGGTIGFACDSPEMAEAWHARRGGERRHKPCEDPPGWREGAAGKVYLAYLFDPFGNKLCALHR